MSADLFVLQLVFEVCFLCGDWLLVSVHLTGLLSLCPFFLDSMGGILVGDRPACWG